MPERDTQRDDLMTAGAIGSLSFISSMLFHEGLGHVGVCTLLGGRSVLYPVSMQANIQSQWMVAAGPSMNFIVGGALWFLMARIGRMPGHLRYFLWLTMAFSLFNAAGYLALSVLANFGDWAVLLRGARPNWLLRGCLALFAGLLYYAFMHAVAFAGRAFLGPPRGKRLTLTPYLVSGAVACTAATLSRSGLDYVFLAAAASLGAGWGLVAIHDWSRDPGGVSAVSPITRSAAWLVASFVVTAFYIAIIGRGLRLPL